MPRVWSNGATAPEEPTKMNMPKVTWTRPKKREKRRPPSTTTPFRRYEQEAFTWDEFQQEVDQDRAESMNSSTYIKQLTWMMAIEQKLGPFEDPDEFVCRQDADTLVDSAQCADCPLNTTCFNIAEADLLDSERRLTEA